LASIGASGHAFNAFASLIDDPEGFRLKLIEKRTAKYVSVKLPTLLELAEEAEEAANALKKLANDAIDYLYGEAIVYCENLIEGQKKEQSLFSFDDLINKLHQTRLSDALKLALRKHYKAVFIDEFQDTDPKQYELFDSFINDDSIVFYIGDPKQSIYSFKGTDIDTYLEAIQKVDQSYTMSQNYRSNAGYISAMNTFFTSNDNPFYDERITYEKVSAGVERPEIKLEGENCNPLSLYKCKNQKEIISQTVSQVKELLMGNYYIGDRRVQASDIGILVRANSKGKEIKVGLNKFRIPAITIDDSRVLESEQSTLLLYLLKAIYEPSTPTINRVLLTCLTSKTKEDLLTYDREVDIEFFKIIHKMWLEKGIFSAIHAFMEHYHTLDHLQSSKTNDAERISSNILQINEILHKKENQSKSSPKDLIHWLETAIAGAEESGDYTQRLENDEDAVKIVTIHKSKGLAYNIVIAPYLDLKSSHDSKWDFIEYKDPESHSYCFASEVTDEAEMLYSEQAERENRRLIYVALTRAVYMGIIIHSSYQAKANRGIKAFIDGVLEKKNWHFEPQLESDNRRYNETKIEIDQRPRQASAVPIESTWSNYSFSALSEYTPHTMPAVTSAPEGYDHFIFDTFPKGALAGNFLHFLFENIDFGSQDFSAGMNKALNRYQSVFPAGDELLEQQLSTMLKHVLEATIPTDDSFTLSQIQADLKLPEVAFDFQMKSFATQQLHGLIPHLDLTREGDIQGMMSGFVDLLFEHKGKFYILDWKSNYLGNKVEDYTEDLLEEAMLQSNYHLQYYIYTVATKLYLQNCIPDFDYQSHFGGVIYIYARGCRQDKSTGVYFIHPDVKVIEDLEALLVG
ncbi:MAG: UvrD-helicase domain-containing protein, partial [Bacteroidales bacterium]|jgi:exodeoxyribonuclease V beta subunit|nr:UvrD-helicase domain-containing protein [Bacteroidales bacterium]